MTTLKEKITRQMEESCCSYPSKKKAVQFIENLYETIFLYHFRTGDINSEMAALESDFENVIKNGHDNVTELKDRFFHELNDIYDKCLNDALAVYEFDPAARSLDDVLNCYPGFFALAIHRVSHLCWNMGLHSIARIFSEYVHSRTGIEIHPGAQIGDKVAIDHGTGIVIGETTIIGNNVKIFQGVTLGALSVGKHKEGQKRHPTIEDNVIIYASATILGGDTVIGENSVIGGNVWLINSVDKNSTVFLEHKVRIKSQNKTHDSFDFVI